MTGVGDETGTIRIGEPGFINACFVQGIAGVTETVTPVVVDGIRPARRLPGAASLGRRKQRQAMQQLKATAEKQAAQIAQQKNQIQTLTAALKQQAEQIQKVSAQLEMIRPTPRVVEQSIRLLLGSAVREVSVSSIQIQPPRESARRLFFCTVAASLCEAPIKACMAPSQAPLTERRLQLNSSGSARECVN